MAFCMKVAQGALPITKCPYMSPEAIALLSEATAPPMKSIEVAGHKLGGETVLFRHEKTFVSRNLFAVSVNTEMDDAAVEAKIAELKSVDYERIGEREYVEFVTVRNCGDNARFVELAKKAATLERGVILETTDVEAAKAAVEAIKDAKPVVNGVNKDNLEAMNELAKAYGIVLGVQAADLNELHDTVEALEKAGNKNLLLDVTGATIKETFGNAVQVRRAALKDNDRTFGYPSIVDLSKLCGTEYHLATALASVFTLKYGSIIIMPRMTYAEALPLYGLRQNIYTDPQKPMKIARASTRSAAPA